jgi:hypothetical protein
LKQGKGTIDAASVQNMLRNDLEKTKRWKMECLCYTTSDVIGTAYVRRPFGAMAFVA